MATKFTVSKSDGNSWLKYSGVLLLGLVFVVFLGVLLFASVSNVFGEKCVAVVNIDGELTTASSPSGLFSEFVPGSEDIARTVDGLNKRDDVGAVVFVINSPGGGVVATREIYEAVKNLKKPKVAYFREVAASGGYYVATGTDYIVSEPLALTGSIGAKISMSDISGLLDKIGVNLTDITSGEEKDIGSPYRPATDKERAVLQALVDEVFSDFKSTIVENRGTRLNQQKFEEVLDARVLSGRQAKDVGLVDALGNRNDAIKKAAQMANITSSSPKICQIAISPESSGGLFDMRSLISSLSASLSNNNAKRVTVSYG